MSSFREHSSWPVFCEHCVDLTSTNTTIEPLLCSNCHSLRVTKYDSKNLVEGGSLKVSSWGRDTLTDGQYFCPSCKKHSLVFSSSPSIFFD